MALEKVGNLGQIELMSRLVNQKMMHAFDNNGEITFSADEAKELDQIVKDFQYVVSNLKMWKNGLESDGYGGLIDVIKTIEKKDL